MDYAKENYIKSQQKNVLVAYLLGALLGGLGLHRFYLKEHTGGLIYIVLFIFGMVIPPLYAVTFCFMVFDFFYTYKLCSLYNSNVRYLIENSK